MLFNNKLLTLGLLSCFTLAACGERDNPLEDKHPIKLAYAIHKLQVDGVKGCSEAFAFPAKASKAEIKACDRLLPLIAQGLNEVNFADTEILPSDLQTPSMWQVFDLKYTD